MNLESRRLGRPPARFPFGGSSPVCSAKGQLGREKIPLGGLTRRLRREMGLPSHGFSPASVPEGFQRASGKPFGASAGAYPLPWVGIDAPTTARERGLQPYGFPPTSVPEGFQRASGKPFGAPAGAYLLPRVGNDVPNTVREQGLPSHGFLANFGARRFPKGERKALWCARRRIPLAPSGA